MALTYRKMKGELERRLHRLTYRDIYEYYHNHVKNDELQGLHRGRDFPSHQLCLSLYHDAFDKGYRWLEANTKAWSHISSKTIQKNAEYIRMLLKGWGKKQVVLGTKEDWNKAAENIPRPKQLEKVNLWLDDTDIQLWGKQVIHPKDDYWSYKLKAPGRRYLSIMDGEGIIRDLQGGYSPKIKGHTFVDCMHEYYEINLKGANIIADSDYRSISQVIEDVTFVTPYVINFKERPNRKRKRDTEDVVTELSAWKVKFNKQHKKLRERIEGPYGGLETYFNILKGPWRESWKQLDNLMWIAVGVYNRNAGNPK